MKTWTTQAEQRLAEYLLERAAREGFAGDDAAELKADLRSHIHEEAERESGEGIGLMQLEGILGRLDAGFVPAPRPVEADRKLKVPYGSYIFGVALPLLVIVFEAITSFCGSAIFDPVPTWWHVLLAGMVPVLNLWLLRGGRGAGEAGKGAAAGFALVTACFYGILFLPIIHFSLIALIFFGLGMISLSPILAALWSWRIGRAARRNSTRQAEFGKGRWIGALAAVMALLVLEGPALWTRGNLSIASKEEDGMALGRLRSYHSERTLLKACYEGSRGTNRATDISGWIMTGWRIAFDGGSWIAADSTEARDVFFRVIPNPTNKLTFHMALLGSAHGRTKTTSPLSRCGGGY